MPKNNARLSTRSINKTDSPSQNTMQIFFKFQKLEYKRLKTIIDNEIFLASPSTFNDPLEGSFSIVDSPDVRDKFTLFCNRLRDYYSSKQPEIITCSERWTAVERVCYAVTLTFAYNIGIASFSSHSGNYETYEDMIKHFKEWKVVTDTKHWAHYADDNKGICLVYLCKKTHSQLKGWTKIKYSPDNRLPKLELSDFEGTFEEQKDRIAKKLYESKSSSWKSEDEYRYIDLTGSKSIKIADIGLELKAIVLGADFHKNKYVEKFYFNSLLQTFSDRNIQVWQSIIDREEYKLQIVPYVPSDL